MSIREGLLAAGIVILVIVVADLIRRYLQRNKLRLAIDDKFKDFPAADLGSELPNGGARVVSKAVPSTRSAEPDTQTRGTSTAMPGEPESGRGRGGNAQSDAWVIDPRLSARRESDEAVDLLLDLEFKGLGEGARRGLGGSETASASSLSAKQRAATEVADEVPAKRSQHAVDALTLMPLSVAKEAESTTANTSLGGGADVELIDLERPVHELLQARQQADLSAAGAHSTSPTALETARPGIKKGAAASGCDLDPAVDSPAPTPTPRLGSQKAQRTDALVSAPDASSDIASDNPPDSLLEDEMLIINVLAKRSPFSGPILFKLVEACGLEFGDQDIYHRYEQANGRGALQFSMANAVRPGTFDPGQQLPPSTPAVTFFLCLADPTDRMTALECMLATAKCVADNLGGELQDEQRSSLRSQTIEHYRQKVRDFERKALTRRR